MMIEIAKPRIPKTPMPIAETLAIVVYSFFEGFFMICQTRLHFRKNDFVWVNNFAMINKEIRSF